RRERLRVVIAFLRQLRAVHVWQERILLGHDPDDARLEAFDVDVAQMHYVLAQRKKVARRPPREIIGRAPGDQLAHGLRHGRQAIDDAHFFAFASATIFSTSASSFFASYTIPSFITHLIPPMRS